MSISTSPMSLLLTRQDQYIFKNFASWIEQGYSVYFDTSDAGEYLMNFDEQASNQNKISFQTLTNAAPTDQMALDDEVPNVNMELPGCNPLIFLNKNTAQDSLNTTILQAFTT